MNPGDLVRPKGTFPKWSEVAIVIRVIPEAELYPAVEVLWSCGKIQSFWVSNMEVVSEGR